MYYKELVICKSLKAGYLQFYDPEHPLAYSNGCGYVHRHMASLKLGRWIETDKHVHHINGNKLDNSLDNLIVLSNSDHIKLHYPNKDIIKYTCLFCEKEFLSNRISNYCSTICSRKSQIKDLSITKDILEELMPNFSWVELGQLFGYSDVGIKKRAKTLGCDMNKAKYIYNRGK